MSKSTNATPFPKESAATTPLGQSLGLNDDEVALMGNLFKDVTGSLGIDGAPVFDRLVQGQSLGQALAIPDAVVESIYARAHSWFSLGRIDRAEPLFRALCFLKDEDADFWIGYGVCLRMTHQSSRALQAFESAARLRPDWAVPYFHILELALHQKQWEQGRIALRAYDERATAEIDSRIVHEVERLRVAVELERSPAPPEEPLLDTVPMLPHAPLTG
ncbi:hypothetical protein [Pseudochelatococcus sp. G4_1912]|uniref:hypothetical protein n=1 Tax=Pseudochelatococcus sp. G4_1912 TaxID=3114288 RepID=UPI0039C5EBFC